MRLAPALLAEFAGTAFLLAAVVGSGIMGERLADGNIGVALLANSLATAGALLALILVCGPLSGAHFNPAVTLVLTARGDLPGARVAPYIAAQLAGAVVGVWAAHLMFELPLLQTSVHVRSGFAQGFSEFVATTGLLATVLGVSRSRPEAVPFAVAGYILAAYWFTASTAFANPAVTLARCLSDTFAGIRPADVAVFLLAQALAAVVMMAAVRGFRHGPISNPIRAGHRSNDC